MSETLLVESIPMKSTHIYCDVCHSIRPLLVQNTDDLADMKYTDAQALECANCGSVIAFIFREKGSVSPGDNDPGVSSSRS